MRQVFPIIIAISILITLNSCSSSTNSISKYNEENFNKKYSSEELKSDLDFMLKTVIDVHPDIYSLIDKKILRSEYEKIKNEIVIPMTRREYFKKVSPLLSILKDGHTSVSFPDGEWENFRNNKGKLFPFFVTYENDCLTIDSSLDANNTLPIGTRIVKINNLPADSLFNEFRKYIGSERNEYNDFITSHYFRKYLWINNINAPFGITFLENSNNAEATIYSDGIERQQQNTNYKYYEYKRLPENIGLIIYNEMRNDNNEPFNEFLEKVFRDLQTLKAKGLIIDLRNNGGGNSDYSMDLLRYITDKPFRNCSKSFRKVSQEYKSQLRNNIPVMLRWMSYPPVIWLGALFSDELKVFTTPEGELIENNYEPSYFGTTKLQYDGKVCFLIGTATFSSAVDLSDAVKTYNLATLIGSETGGIPTAYGDRYDFTLPNTNLEVSVASAKFIRANGDATSKNGVVPDIEIKQTLEDSKNNTDTIIEKAKEWILK